MIQMQHLAQNHHAQQRAEDGDQVDEDAGAVGADDLVALDEQDKIFFSCNHLYIHYF